MTSQLEIDVVAEDLLVRARRGELSDNERRKLRMLLESSKELELLYLAGKELDRSSALVAGDEARMQRLVELGRAFAADAARPVPTPLRRTASSRSAVRARSVAMALGVGAVLGASVSAAVQYGTPYLFARRAEAPPSIASSGPAPVKSPPARARSSAKARDLTPPTAESAAPSSIAAPVALARPTQSIRRDLDATAGALFAKAAAARRNGDRASAIRLYEQLCERFPASLEAADARVSLGKLKLEQRSAAAALKHFEDYPPGSLSVEALWGQAEALRQMSNARERAALERIVLEYPDSPYAMAARKRLASTR